MNALILADLANSQDLDREAAATISGSGLAKQSVHGSHYKLAELVVRSSIDFNFIKEFDVVDAIIGNVR